MNSNILMYEGITENIIAIKVNQSYKENMTEIELYDITRGFWKVDIKKAQQADYAISVYKGTIIEVYKIEKWLPAGLIKRTTLPEAEVPKGRYGFDGEIAEKEIRDKYIGKSIATKGAYPINYFLPLIEEAQKIEEEISFLNVEGESKKAIINVRVNQGKFRELLINRYNKCCLCNIKKHELLIASHIKPWVESKPKEKLDVDNGFLMCPNHDKIFDKGYITFDDDGKIIISEELTENDKMCLNFNSRMRLNVDLTDGNKKYLKFHRENVFIG